MDSRKWGVGFAVGGMIQLAMVSLWALTGIVSLMFNVSNLWLGGLTALHLCFTVSLVQLYCEFRDEKEGQEGAGE